MNADLLDRELAALDPVRGVHAGRDPEAVLSAILRAAPEPAVTSQRTRPRGLRLAALAAAATALVAVPVLGGGDTAYAGWTAYPAALSTGQASSAARQCQTWVRGSITQAPTTVVLSERRGDIGLALLTGPDGLLVTCELHLGSSGEPSGGASEAYLAQTPRPDQLLSDGGSAFSEGDDEPIFRVVSGKVGTGVTGVVLHTEEQGDVIATVHGGYFTAWWPGPPESSAARPAGPLPMGFTITATLSDGSSRTFTRAEASPDRRPEVPRGATGDPAP